MNDGAPGKLSDDLQQLPRLCRWHILEPSPQQAAAELGTRLTSGRHASRETPWSPAVVALGRLEGAGCGKRELKFIGQPPSCVLGPAPETPKCPSLNPHTRPGSLGTIRTLP